MAKGGYRVNAGRKPSGKPTTKATIYLEDRQILNDYAKSFGITVNELIHRIINNSNIQKIIENFED